MADRLNAPRELLVAARGAIALDGRSMARGYFSARLRAINARFQIRNNASRYASESRSLSRPFADRSRRKRKSHPRMSTVARIKRHVRGGQASSPREEGASVASRLPFSTFQLFSRRAMLVGAENASVIYSLACLRRETSSLPDGRWILEETETVARRSERPTVEAAAAALSRSRCQRRTFFVRLLSRDHAQRRTRHSRLAMRDGWRPDPIRARVSACVSGRQLRVAPPTSGGLSR